MAYEFQKIGQDKFVLFQEETYEYDISEFSDYSNLKVYARANQYVVHDQEIVEGYYSFSTSGGLKIVFDEGFPIDSYYSFKVMDIYATAAKQTSITTVSDITPENLNTEFDNLYDIVGKIQDTYNKRGYKLDADEESNILPYLPTSHFWAKDLNGNFKAVPLADILATYPDPGELFELYGITAETLTFDKTGTDLSSEETGAAIKEVNTKANTKLTKGTYSGADAQALKDDVDTRLLKGTYSGADAQALKNDITTVDDKVESLFTNQVVFSGTTADLSTYSKNIDDVLLIGCVGANDNGSVSGGMLRYLYDIAPGTSRKIGYDNSATLDITTILTVDSETQVSFTSSVNGSPDQSTQVTEVWVIFR